MSLVHPSRRGGLFHVITGLAPGGAELALLRLVENIILPPGCVTVVSLTENDGEIGTRLAAAGAEVLALGMARGIPDPRGLWRLARLLRHRRPALVQSWMYHADLLAGLAARLAGGVPVVWNVRNGSVDVAGVRRSTRWTARVAGRLARWLPVRIVCCSRAAREIHIGLGYPEERMVLIPNGFDLTHFQPDLQDRQRVRAELGIAPNASVVGCIGRFDPVKDHRGFLQAAARVATRHADACFVLCGAGVDPGNGRIIQWVRELGLEQRCRLLGHRTDLERIYRSLDVLVLASSTEAFPNVVGEAMASGVPCVVTSVGDAS
ncbi:MAG TPA: glycosyltransferase, partial [Gammaproteobacteria bacterium]|nr:glycosyltransferase [Gammaproteobacteria bacterium]